MQDIELNLTLNDALNGLTAVKQNLSRFRTWPNYGIARQVAEERLNECQQHLHNLLAANDATPAKLRALIEWVNTDTLPLLQQIIAYNLKMIGMGPLNTHRKLDSRSGRAHNATLQKAQGFLQQLIAQAEAIMAAAEPVETSPLPIETPAIPQPPPQISDPGPEAPNATVEPEPLDDDDDEDLPELLADSEDDWLGLEDDEEPLDDDDDDLLELLADSEDDWLGLEDDEEPLDDDDDEDLLELLADSEDDWLGLEDDEEPFEDGAAQNVDPCQAFWDTSANSAEL